MKSPTEYEKTARPGTPFSNGTEWEIWQYATCMGNGNDSRRCINDDNDSCPLIMLSLNEMHPAEWTGPRGRYRCSEKTTPADARREAAAAQQAAIDAAHHGVLFEIEEGH